LLPPGPEGKLLEQQPLEWFTLHKLTASRPV